MNTRRRSIFLVMVYLAVAATLCSTSASAAMGDGKQHMPQEIPYGSSVESAEWTWTSWNPVQYALADDGTSIWIGTAQGIVRWDKASNSYERITRFEGFPSTHVYAVAVDEAGNRWFGGDGGLSQLDVDGRWRHFTAANSGMSDDNVDGIAVGADGTLWISHGLPDGAVSRRDAGGTWRVFPNPAVAITVDYQAVLATRNRNPLWTVSGADVWMGYWAYDGQAWHDRSPFAGTRRALKVDGLPEDFRPYPIGLDVDSSGRVWALSIGSLRAWSAGIWADHTPRTCGAYHSFQALALADDDTVWIGYESLMVPDADWLAGVSPLPVDPNPILCDIIRKPAPVTALLGNQEGVWAIGPGWLLRPGDEVTSLDLPEWPTVSDIVMLPTGELWVHSWDERNNGVVDAVRDHGTGKLGDDQWQVVDVVDALTGWDLGPDGDVYLTLYWNGYHCPCPSPPLRWHRGVWIPIDPPLFWSFYSDVFVQDGSHVWFAGEWDGPAEAGRGVVGLDDNQTPLNPTDDRWTILWIGDHLGGDYPNPGVVAVDSSDQVWYGDPTGLYRYMGSAWQSVFQDQQVCDLVPAQDGKLFILGSYRDTECRVISPVVHVWDGLRLTEISIVELAPMLVGSGTHHNPLWSMAPDGAVWYYEATWRELRCSGCTDIICIDLQADMGDISTVAAGPDNRVWGVIGSRLWRLSPQPDFRFDDLLGQWLLEPVATRDAVPRSKLSTASTGR